MKRHWNGSSLFRKQHDSFERITRQVLIYTAQRVSQEDVDASVFSSHVGCRGNHN